MRLRAMAKINLGLDVIRKREDGYHEVRMIMQTVRMYDTLEIRKKQAPGISLRSNLPYVPSDERNLVYKAAKILMDEFHVEEGLSMKLTKSIPVAAGMAGLDGRVSERSYLVPAALCGSGIYYCSGSDFSVCKRAGCTSFGR